MIRGTRSLARKQHTLTVFLIALGLPLVITACASGGRDGAVDGAGGVDAAFDSDLSPPADVPAPPADVPAPPADVPAPPADVPSPPADVPAPPADVPTPPADVPTPPARTRIYAAFVSHNEEQPHVACTPVLTDRARYVANREQVVALAEALVTRGAAWDFQSDWEYLEAVARWDTADVTGATGGLDIVRWLAARAPAQIVVDAHAHETRYNYADVVHLLDGFGVARNGVVGGFLYLPVEDEAWTRLRAPLAGAVFPDALWTAEILWGAGTRNHRGADSNASGIWRPRDPAHFHEDDPAARLPCVGTGRAGLPPAPDGIQDLLDRLRRGELEEGRLYTATVFVAQCALDADLVAAAAALVDAHEGDVAAGDLVWATLPEMVRAWRGEYGSAPVVFEPPAAPTGCGGGPACAEGTVCCPEGLPCAGRCVADCRTAGTECPPVAPACDAATGLCQPEGATAPGVDLGVTNPASGVAWWAQAWLPIGAGPERPAPAVVLVPGGSGPGSAQESSEGPLGLLAAGYVVVLFDPDGRGRTGGLEDDNGFVHQDGLAAVIEATAARPEVDPTRIALLTQSYGITMGSGALARHPDLPVAALVDWEGPADRTDTGGCDADGTGHLTHDCADDAWWAEREAVTFARGLPVPYLRMQRERDHAQPDNLHAIRMVNAATAVAHGGEGQAPWTRVNDATMNLANQVYTAAAPPVWLANDAVDRTAQWIVYLDELLR